MTRGWLLLGILVFSPARADLQGGNWELTATTTIGGLPNPIGVTQTRCITAEDARDPSRIFGAQKGPCTFSDRNDNGAVYTFSVSCGIEPPMKGSGRVEYSATTFEADLDLRAEAGGQSLVTRSHISGRRLGGC